MKHLKKIHRELRNMALESLSEKSQTLSATPGGGPPDIATVTPGDVLLDIARYITARLALDDNPIPFLRKYFPGFAWVFHSFDIGWRENTSKWERFLVKAVKTADYVFGVDEGGTTLVSARRFPCEAPRRLCFDHTVFMLSITGEFKSYGWPVLDLGYWHYDSVRGALKGIGAKVVGPGGYSYDGYGEITKTDKGLIWVKPSRVANAHGGMST